MMNHEERKQVAQAVNRCRDAMINLDRNQVLEVVAFMTAAWIKTMSDIGEHSIEDGKGVVQKAINGCLAKYFLEL